jgi:uncharacterized protein YcbK (DUF882 family)
MAGIIARPERSADGERAASVLRRVPPLAGKRVSLLTLGLLTAASSLLMATARSQDASADGDTRTLTFFHTHRRESATVTFRRNGQYDDQALSQLNWFLRDWRNDKPAQMDPHLFDILWEVYRESGSSQPINIISAYRSPETNSALRRRSSGVAEHSQHMLGKAMDIRLPDVDTARLRAIAMRMQYGGVGYYNSSNFVHVDTGNVRAWPRMTQQQLVGLFPDGKTLHLPTNGKPLPGYEQAKAEILPRNAALAARASAGGGPSLGGLLANLFGRKNTAPESRTVTASTGEPTELASAEPVAMSPPAVPIPMPPQRPPELRLASAVASNAQSDGIGMLAQAAQPVPRLEPILGYDEKAAVKALFDPRAAFLDLGFEASPRQELSVTQFMGPAVKPLPTIRQTLAEL